MELKEVLELIELLKSKKTKTKLPFVIGENYFIRTITHYYTGKLIAIHGQFLELDQASWIADTGRFHDFLKDGKCNEYESFVNTVFVPIHGIVDITKWTFPLFKGQK